MDENARIVCARNPLIGGRDNGARRSAFSIESAQVVEIEGNIHCSAALSPLREMQQPLCQNEKRPGFFVFASFSVG
jgi:hypothetical protein